MDFIQDIKDFFKKLGLNWNGFINKRGTSGFVEARSENFEDLQQYSFNIDFKEGGMCGLCAEIDTITFKINNEDLTYQLSYLNEDFLKNIEKIRSLEEKDFSREFIQFQIQRHGLIYATMVRQKCDEKKSVVQEESNKRVKQLTRKIEYLNRCVQKTEEEASDKIKDIEDIESLIEDVE